MKRLLRVLPVVALLLLFGGTTVAAASVAAPVATDRAVSSNAQASAPTGVEDFEFASYDADYYLGIDAADYSTLRTVETLVAVFPDFDQNRGIIRAIPNFYDGVPLLTRVVGVVDERGKPVPYEVLGSGEFTELALGNDDFVHGRTTYVITYEQRNVVRAFADTAADEFYWDTNGTGWAQPFHSVGVRVHVSAELAELLTGDAACYTGAFGESGECEIEQTQDADGPLFVASGSDFGPGQNLTVAIAFQPGTFVQVEPVSPPNQGPDTGLGPDFELGFPFTTTPEARWWVDAGNVAAALVVLLGTGFTIVWRFIRPSSSKGSGIIVPQYTVPKDLNLLEAAEIIGKRGNGVSAQIVSFAVRGKLRILDYPVTSSGARYTLQLLSLDGLDEHELALMRAIFSDSAVQTLSTLLAQGTLGSLQLGVFGDSIEQTVAAAASQLPPIGAVQEVGVVDDGAASAIAAVTATVRKDVLSRGLLQKRSPALGITMAVVMFVMSFVSMGVFMLSAFLGVPNLWGIAAFVLSILAVMLCLGFAFRPPVPTAAGAVHHDYLVGMRDYLQLAEEDRLRMLQSPEGAQRVRAEGIDPRIPAQRVKLYEKLLPFAVLWGVERDWSKELTILYEGNAPDWFVTTGSFNASSFTMAVGSIATAPVARATARTSSSSGSSWSGSSGGSFSGGSSGGGFSGGGGGGGGGGGR